VLGSADLSGARVGGRVGAGTRRSRAGLAGSQASRRLTRYLARNARAAAAL